MDQLLNGYMYEFPAIIDSFFTGIASTTRNYMGEELRVGRHTVAVKMHQMVSFQFHIPYKTAISMENHRNHSCCDLQPAVYLSWGDKGHLKTTTALIDVPQPQKQVTAKVPCVNFCAGIYLDC